MKQLSLLLILSSFILSISAIAQRNSLKKAHVLIYTKNGKGYVHDNIPSAVEAIKKLGTTVGFKAVSYTHLTLPTKRIV